MIKQKVSKIKNYGLKFKRKGYLTWYPIMEYQLEQTISQIGHN